MLRTISSSSLVFAFSLVGLAMAGVACSGANDASSPGSAGDEDGGGATDDGGTGGGGNAGSDGGHGSHVDAGPSSDGGATDGGSSAFQSDPSNCGSAGHSCDGATCTKGFCDAEEVRANGSPETMHFAIEGGQLVTAHEADTTTHVCAVRRGPITPHAADADLFSSCLGSSPNDVPQMTSTAIYSTKALSGFHSGLASVAIPSGAATDISADARSFQVDGDTIYFTDNDGGISLWTVPTSGGTRTAFGHDVAGSVRRLAVDATDVYAVNFNNAFYRVPKAGGAAVKLAVTLPSLGTDPFVTSMVLTPTRIVGVLSDYASLSCTTASYVVFSIPKTGGTATTLFAAAGYVSQLTVDGENVYYWPTSNCNPGHTPFHRIPADGSTPAVAITDWPSAYVEEGHVDGDYLYFLTSPGGIYRVAK